MNPLVSPVSSLGENVSDVPRSPQFDFQILKKVIVVGGPSVLAVEPGVGSLSLRIGVGGGRHGAVGDASVLNAQRLDFSTNVFNGIGGRGGGGEGNEGGNDDDDAQTQPGGR